MDEKTYTYIHQKNPFVTLPVKLNDQVASDIVGPRTIHVTKAHKYSHSYDVEEMHCQIYGVHTLLVTDRPLVKNDSLLR